jgi:phosphotransferase system enzyme I (PtsI)
MRLIGIGASPGIGIGPVFRYEREELAVREWQVSEQDADAELARFRLAVEKSRRELERIRDGIAHELGDEEARIYETHLLILDDPELWRAVEDGVRRDRRNSAVAFRSRIGQVAAHLEHVSNENMRERRADLIDVERRVLRHLLGDSGRALAALTDPAVIVAHDLGPSEVALLNRDRVIAFVTEVGGRTSHSAIVARGRGIPAVVSARGAMQHARTGEVAAVDGEEGRVELNPDATVVEEFHARRRRFDELLGAYRAARDEPAMTRDGHRVELGANIELPSEAELVAGSGADGIGLFRTEFFYMNRQELPTEDEQYEAYRMVAEQLEPKPVIFRTMDLGGDKVASYLGTTHETNPFLGWRGIRFALNHPELFRTQLRAIYRASAHGRVRIMFPMVSSEDELLRACAACREVENELSRQAIPHDAAIEMGVMIETPSSVWMADALARHVKFLSIGSNDLTQYTLAIDRDNPRLAHLYEPLDPAVLRSIRHTVEAGQACGCWVGICGEMAGDPRNAVLLVGLGVDELSMSSFDLPRVKAAIRAMDRTLAQAVAEEALACSSARCVKQLLSERVDPLLPGFLRATADES